MAIWQNCPTLERVRPLSRVGKSNKTIMILEKIFFRTPNEGTETNCTFLQRMGATKYDPSQCHN